MCTKCTAEYNKRGENFSKVSALRACCPAAQAAWPGLGLLRPHLLGLPCARCSHPCAPGASHLRELVKAPAPGPGRAQELDFVFANVLMAIVSDKQGSVGSCSTRLVLCGQRAPILGTLVRGGRAAWCSMHAERRLAVCVQVADFMLVWLPAPAFSLG